MSNILPIFRTHYSLGRSILTVDSPSKDNDINQNYPISIFDIAIKHQLSQVTLVDETISGFLEAYTNSKKAKIKLNYGLQLRCMESIDNKNDAALKTISKIIVFMKNSDGYSDLIKISSCAAKDGFYYKPNIDFAHLKSLWTKNLSLAIPFYDSFLFMNSLEGYLCVPNFSFTEPVFFIENSNLPFDKFIQGKVQSFAKSVNAEILPTRSIYYYRRNDFLSYLTFRCIHKRTSLEKPEFNHMSSDAFCFEEWKRQEENPETVNLL